jgi:hypothetical protein
LAGFVSSPFGVHPDAVLFREGDFLCHWRSSYSYL